MEHPDTTRAASVPDAAAADYHALTRGAGVRRLSGRIIVRMVGDDRVTFLHGMCSADIQHAGTGQVVPALFLTEHAHLLADFFAWITKDAILIDIDAELWGKARAHLERLLVADDVEFENTDLAAIDITGPRAGEAIRALGVEPPAVAGFTSSGEMLIGDAPRLGVPAYSVLVPARQSDAVIARLVNSGPNVRLVGDAAAEIVRIEQGSARVGTDTTDKTIALEAGLRSAISFDKGCYVGQETIERATARGGLKKKLVGLTLKGLPQHTNAAVMLAGKEVGRLTSAALSPKFGVIGLAIVQQAAWGAGTRVEVAGAGAAIVAEVPFGTSLK